MTDTIISLLNDITGADEGEITPDTALFEDGILDSFGLVQLLVGIETQCGVSLAPAALERAQVATPALIAAAVEAAKG